MKIRITSFVTIDRNTVVDFSSGVGSGVSTWVSASKPVKGYEYDAEIDIEKSIDQVINSSKKNEDRYSITSDGSTTLMNGEVESVEEDGMTYFRLSRDCLIMIESGDSNVKEGDWISLNIQFEDIEISAQVN